MFRFNRLKTMYSETVSLSAFNTLTLFVDVLLFSFQGSLERNRISFLIHVTAVSAATLILYQVANFMSTTFSKFFFVVSLSRKCDINYHNTFARASQQLIIISLSTFLLSQKCNVYYYTISPCRLQPLFQKNILAWFREDPTNNLSPL